MRRCAACDRITATRQGVSLVAVVEPFFGGAASAEPGAVVAAAGKVASNRAGQRVAASARLIRIGIGRARAKRAGMTSAWRRARGTEKPLLGLNADLVVVERASGARGAVPATAIDDAIVAETLRANRAIIHKP